MIPILSVRMPNGTVIDIPALVGRRGVSITDIKRTSGDGSPGSTDTYTIALSDGGTHDFQVYHGKDGSGSGDMLAAVYDPRGKRQDIFAYVESLIPTLESLGAEASGSAAKALTDAKSYTDTKIADLINSAPTTLDTLGEIATAMEENADVVDALDAAVGSKAAAADLTGHTGNKSNPHGVTAEQIGAATAAEVESLKRSVSEGKAAIASAITDKGVSTSSDAAFSTMAANIRQIATGLGTTLLDGLDSTTFGSSSDISFSAEYWDKVGTCPVSDTVMGLLYATANTAGIILKDAFDKEHSVKWMHSTTECTEKVKIITNADSGTYDLYFWESTNTNNEAFWHWITS